MNRHLVVPDSRAGWLFLAERCGPSWPRRGVCTESCLRTILRQRHGQGQWPERTGGTKVLGGVGAVISKQ